MIRLTRTLLLATALALPLGACASMSDFTIDPSEWLAGDWFGNKKKLPGDRKPVFPEGVPGVSKGIPQDLVKGYQQQPDAVQDDPITRQALIEPEAKPKPKPKPKPKVAAKPAPVEQESRPTPVTVRRSDAPPSREQPAAGQWPDAAPPRQQQPSASPWPDAPPARQSGGGGGVQWPDPPSR
jgi:outer membrane biosynthesis protein TonB